MATTSKAYIISAMFAKTNSLPVSFIATVLRETEKAVYLYGHGSTEPTGRCVHCGRLLTHPGSIMLGIGPECLGNWGLRDIKIENPSPEDIARVEKTIQEKIVDQWMPKAVIKTAEDSLQHVAIPSTHKMLVSSPKATATRQALLVRYKDSGENVIKITFPYSNSDLHIVKGLPGRKWNVEGKFWTAPLSIEAVETLREAGFILSDNLVEYIAKLEAPIASPESIVIPGLGGKLMPFQQEGVAFAESREGRVLIADEQGLGKTVQALAWLQLHPEARPAVVVCPASLKLNWEREANKWISNPKVQVLQGTDNTQPLFGEIIIINYDILGNSIEKYTDERGKKHTRELMGTGWVDVLISYGVSTVIIDECQYIKNNGTMRTNGTKRLGKQAEHVIGLSGTPIESRPVEFFNILQLINKDIMPNWWSFVNKYCGAKKQFFGWDFSGASNTLELHELLTKTIMVRRLKADVLPELPDKQYGYIPMEMDNWQTYREAQNGFLQYIAETRGMDAAKKASNAQHLAKIEALKQLAVAGKLKQSISWIQDRIEAGDKLVVFAVHKAVIEALMDKFTGKAVKVDGSVSSSQRQQAVDQFQNDESIRLFVGNIKAAGVGLTLTASSTVVFLELPWTSSDLSQAEDRCHRIGQKSSVNVYYLLASGTIEEDIAELLDNKRQVLDSVLDGRETDEGSLLTELMKRMEKEI